jgi:hypothetical protein
MIPKMTFWKFKNTCCQLASGVSLNSSLTAPTRLLTLFNSACWYICQALLWTYSSLLQRDLSMAYRSSSRYLRLIARGFCKAWPSPSQPVILNTKRLGLGTLDFLWLAFHSRVIFVGPFWNHVLINMDCWPLPTDLALSFHTWYESPMSANTVP